MRSCTRLQNKSIKPPFKSSLQNKCMYCGSAFPDSVQLTQHLMKELRERTVKENKETEDAKCEIEGDEKKELKERTVKEYKGTENAKRETKVDEQNEMKE